MKYQNQKSESATKRCSLKYSLGNRSRIPQKTILEELLVKNQTLDLQINITQLIPTNIFQRPEQQVQVSYSAENLLTEYF